jgi:hypothetical protein
MDPIHPIAPPPAGIPPVTPPPTAGRIDRDGRRREEEARKRREKASAAMHDARPDVDDEGGSRPHIDVTA